MDKKKLIHQLFVGKVCDILGFEKTTNLLKDATDEINKAFKDEDLTSDETTKQVLP